MLTAVRFMNCFSKVGEENSNKVVGHGLATGPVENVLFTFDVGEKLLFTLFTEPVCWEISRHEPRIAD